MSMLNAILRPVFDGLLYPFRGFPPIVGLVVVSLVTAVGMLLVFKATSNQEKLAAVKRRIHACLFEIRLFNDDLRAILRAQLEILRRNLTYLRLSLVPMLWMLLPLVLVIAHLQFHYGYRGLKPGETALLKVELGDGWKDSARPSLTLEVPEGLRAQQPPVWIPSLKEMIWRITAERGDDYDLKVNLAGKSYTKAVRVSDSVVRLSPVRSASGFIKVKGVPFSLPSQLVYPAEAPLPKSGPIKSITLRYPDGRVGILGFQVHWMVVFFILSILFSFVLRNRLKVTI